MKFRGTGRFPAHRFQLMKRDRQGDRACLTSIARRAMIERKLEPDFSPAALQELAGIRGPAMADGSVRDLRGLLWRSRLFPPSGARRTLRFGWCIRRGRFSGVLGRPRRFFLRRPLKPVAQRERRFPEGTPVLARDELQNISATVAGAEAIPEDFFPTRRETASGFLHRAVGKAR